MNLQLQIDGLRRRYHSGDESAREALQNLLRAYMVLIVRRAARAQNAGSRAARGIRRLAGETSPTGPDHPGQGLPSADEVCRQLCDELLQGPAVTDDPAPIMETIRKVGRQTECDVATFGGCQCVGG